MRSAAPLDAAPLDTAPLAVASPAVAPLTVAPLAVAALLTVVALVAAPAEAIVYVMPTDESMVDRSPVIVFGEVLAAEPAPVEGVPSTDFRFRVEDVLKGFVPGSNIVVRQPGGRRADGLVGAVMGLPRLAEGDRVLLFLDPADAVYRTVELALGMFFEAPSPGGAVLLREASLREEMSPRGGSAALQERRQPRHAERFRSWIADRAGGFERPADYFLPEPGDNPTGRADPFLLILTPGKCERPGVPVRWREFDSNEGVGLAVQAEGQPGVPGGGMAQVLAGMAAWNDDPLSRARFVSLGTSNEAFSLDADGRNSITFEDPHDEIPGSFHPASGGILAINTVYFYCDREIEPHRIPGGDSTQFLAIVETNITTQDGSRDWLAVSPNPSRNFEEIMGHELGHGLGIDHPCSYEGTGTCSPQEEEALMRAYAHEDGRGARLGTDDLAAVRYLYPASAPLAPADVDVTATNSTTVRVTWRDRSRDEEGFTVWNRLDPASTNRWKIVQRSAADAQEAVVQDLRPGERYHFLVRAFRGDLYADSDSVAVTMPDGDTTAGSLQGARFDVRFSALANGKPVDGRASWSSDQGVVYWLFDSQNPEALVKVLDGRGLNGHWWFDLAVASDLLSVARVTHRGAGTEWVAVTGFGKDVFAEPGEAANRLVYCAYPANRTDDQCAVSGYGTTISLRDAWDASGNIPASHYD